MNRIKRRDAATATIIFCVSGILIILMLTAFDIGMVRGASLKEQELSYSYAARDDYLELLTYPVFENYGISYKVFPFYTLKDYLMLYESDVKESYEKTYRQYLERMLQQDAEK